MNADYTIRLILVIFAIILISLILWFQVYKCYIICSQKNQSISPEEELNNLDNV